MTEANTGVQSCRLVRAPSAPVSWIDPGAISLGNEQLPFSADVTLKGTVV